jgi:hypothetical protein
MSRHIDGVIAHGVNYARRRVHAATVFLIISAGRYPPGDFIKSLSESLW